MLSKNQRISRNRLNYLLKKGLKVTDQFFQIKFALNKARYNRYSVVVSKKILKLATDRNRLRRQIYEVLQGIKIDSINCFDSVITVKSSLDKLDFPQKQHLLRSLLEQIAEQINHGQQSPQKSSK